MYVFSFNPQDLNLGLCGDSHYTLSTIPATSVSMGYWGNEIVWGKRQTWRASEKASLSIQARKV